MVGAFCKPRVRVTARLTAPENDVLYLIPDLVILPNDVFNPVLEIVLLLGRADDFHDPPRPPAAPANSRRPFRLRC